jgi:hypothetical protein
MLKRILTTAVFCLALAVCANAQGHHASFSWTLSTDDTTTTCAAPNTCSQTIYRIAGACGTAPTFTTPLSSLSATATTYTDSTIVPGIWCYGLSFTQNGLESAKDFVTVSLPPASQTGFTETGQS